MRLKKDFKEFIELLNANGVKYVIVGAYAVAFHGLPRYTRDIDFLVEASRENGQKLVSTLKAFGFDSLKLSQADFARPDQIIQLGVAPTRIDLITSIDAVDFEEAYAAREVIEVEGMKLSFLSREHLLRNKRKVGRPQDVADATRLEDLHE